MRKWYCSPTCKGFLLILAHICAILSAVSFAWIGMTAGMRYMLPFEKAPSQYEQTAGFEEQMEEMSRHVLDQLSVKGRFETDGKYNPDKLIDVARYASGSVKQDGTNKTGIAYKLRDLERWSKSYTNAMEQEEKEDQFLNDYGTTVVVCLQNDGNYHYYYGDDFRNRMLSGELTFSSNGEYVSNEEKLNALINENTNSIGFGQVLDQNGEILYTDCWNLGLGYEVIKEPYSLDGAQNLVELANTDSRWNGRLADAYHALTATLQTIGTDLASYREDPRGWEEGNTNYTYIYANYDTQQIYSNRQEYQDIKSVDEYKDAVKKLGAYVIVTPKLAGFESTFENPAERAQEWKSNVVEVQANITNDTNYVFMAAVDTTYPVPDEFENRQNIYEKIIPYVDTAVDVAWGGLISFFMILIWLTIISGRSWKSEGDTVVLAGFDKWKTEIAAITVGGLWTLAIYICSNWISNYVSAYEYYYEESNWSRESIVSVYAVLMVGIIALISCVFFFWAYLSLVRRIKAKTLWKNSILKGVCDTVKLGWTNRSSMFQTMILYVLFLIVELITWGNTPLLLIGIAVNIGVAIGLIRYVSARQKIKKGITEIAKGNVNYKIPLDGLKGESLEIAQTVNKLGEGLNKALEKSVQDERLKTDLITNVSHDIKTPLTSIINYVAILKRENFQDPKIRNYLDILETKAERLKTLTEDVVEASKVSSGNIKLELMTLNMVEMIYQVEAEYEEKFEARDLKVVFNMPDEPALIRVDGRRLWRVFANVFNNAAKYAMEGTRVYADLIIQPGTVKFVLKNVSDQQLNFSADELTERFIRGDVSRSTEGSGLGLSIAKNLTTLQGGTFDLYLDGDLFKVIISFPRVRKTETKKTAMKEKEKEI